VKSRELKALIKASSELSCNKLKVLTWDNEDIETYEGKRVEFIPLWSWLVQK
jgi:predicted AAA+ superfamily ATPase